MSILNAFASRRSATIAAALAGVISLGLGAHAALNKRSAEIKPAPTAIHQATVGSAQQAARVALVIGNGHYPDAGEPLMQPINDARAITAALRRDGFDVDVIEDATHDDMQHAIERFRQKITPASVALLFFGGFGVQSGRESYMIPVDAAIWKEADVRRQGVSIEEVLAAMKEGGARTKFAVIDASRRNPYERRFRSYSHGLAPITAPENALILSSTTPGKVADDGNGENSLLVSELLDSMKSDPHTAEAVFSRTRTAVARASEGQQVPTVSSSLLEDIPFSAQPRAVAAGG